MLLHLEDGEDDEVGLSAEGTGLVHLGTIDTKALHLHIAHVLGVVFV
jgi:hypothetical protein